MKKRSRQVFVLALISVLAIPLFGADSASVVPLRRFALVVGSNNGGPTRVKLKYAASDAKAFASVLKELGGVKDSDMVMLFDPSVAAFEGGLAKMGQMAASTTQGEERKELVIYYSGHSDENGLILGMETFPYEEFRKQIVDVQADVRVAVLDSCASGALTRVKGGVWRPAFLMDASMDMKGHAFLTSSSEDESAQESDRLGASFFTHFLVSALRGAGDANADGLVSLNEAYAFAFQETLASTEKTQYGPQHPAYDINLTGSGDLVLTDLRAVSAGLTVAEDVAGRLYIRDSRGVLAVELNKLAGQKVDLGLEPGTYGIVLDAKEARFSGQVSISTGKRSVLSSADLRVFTADRTVSRGDVNDEPGLDAASGDASPVLPDWGFSLSIIPEILGKIFSSDSTRTVSINIFMGAGENMSGFEVGSLVNFESGYAKGFQAAGLGNVVLGEIDCFQAAGVLNFGGESARPFQMSGVANVNMKDFWGFQSAGVANFGFGDSAGAVFGGVFNFSGGLCSGFDAAGVANIAFGGLKGVQLAGVVNVTAGVSDGAQVSGVFNYAQDLFEGAQVSGVANYAREVSGPQFSVVNVADTVNGAQVGIVNIAGNVRGTQIGILNFARVIDGIPFGLITFEQAGRQDVEAWWDTSNTVSVGFKLGSRYTYTFIMGSYALDSNPIRWAYGLGFGGHIPAGPLFVDFDLSLLSTHTGESNWYLTAPGNMLPRLRAILGLPIFGFTITGGASVDAYIPGVSSEPDGTPTGVFRLDPRLLVGVQM
jgi:hypothetical protein